MSSLLKNPFEFYSLLFQQIHLLAWMLTRENKLSKCWSILT